MAEKSSFVLYDKYDEQIKMLSDQQAGQLLKAIYACRAGQERAVEDPAVAILWSVIRQQMAVDERKYQEVCDKRRSAGQKGGRPTKSAAERKLEPLKEREAPPAKANAFLASVVLADDDDDLEGDDDKTLFPPKCPQKAADWHERFSPAMGEKLDEWLAYKAEKRQKYKPQGLKTLLSKTAKEIAEHGEQAVMEAIDCSMSSGYQGIVWDRVASPFRRQNAEQAQPFKGAASGSGEDGLEDLLAQIQAWEEGGER